jgi:acetyl-CoA carboxylase alpha subunit
MRFLPPAAIHAADPALLGSIVESREMVVAAGAGTLSGLAVAVLLFADFAALHDDATLTVDCPEAWAAVVARIGRRAIRLQVNGAVALTAAAAAELQLVDALVAAERDPVEWFAGWVGERSEQALDSAAMLIRLRGGDRLERAEFARLFALGDPQRGLDAFLNRRRPQ